MRRLVVEVDGRRLQVEVPDGMSDAEILADIESQLPGPSREQRQQAAVDDERAIQQKKINDSLSGFDKFVVGMGRGFTDLGQGAKQLGMNIGAKVGLVDDEDAEAYNREVADEEELFEYGLGDSNAAGIGRIAGQVAGTAPAGGLGWGAKTVGAAAKTGALQGAIGGLVQTDADGDDDYFGDKVTQVGLGTVGGAGLGAGGKKVADKIVDAINLPRRAANAVIAPQAQPGPTTQAQRIVSGSPVQIRKGDRTAQSTGIDLSPGQRSGGKAATMLENIARGSVWTRDTMFTGDFARARQMLNAINRTARSISPDAPSPEGFAANLQGTVAKMTDELASKRSAFGRQAYGAIEKAAGGQPIVQTRATLDEIANVVDEFGSVQGSDAQAIARQAEAFFNKLKGDGAITPGLALRQMQAWEKAARTGTGLFEGVQDRSTAKTIAGRLARALEADMDATADTVGGTLGESLRAANKGWREYSQQIDALEKSALGRVVGEEFASDMGQSISTVTPEKVWTRLDAMSASDLAAVKGYLTKHAPDMWKQYQRLALERARDMAQASAPSAGARDLPINSGAFVGAVAGKGGQKGVDATRRLKVLFGDSPELERQVAALLDAGRRMADATGRNFSGTAGANEVLQMPGTLMDRVASGAKAAAGYAGPLIGLRAIAQKAAQPQAQRAIPLLGYSERFPKAASIGVATGMGGLAKEATETPLEIDIGGGSIGSSEDAQRDVEIVRRWRQQRGGR